MESFKRTSSLCELQVVRYIATALLILVVRCLSFSVLVETQVYFYPEFLEQIFKPQ